MNLLFFKLLITVVTLKFLHGQLSVKVSPDTTVLVGSNVTVVCTLHSFSGNNDTPIHVKWKKPENVHNINCAEPVTTRTVSCNFTLESVKESSGGKYTCDGYDGYDTLTRSTELLVVPYPTIELRDACAGHQLGNIETGPVCIPTTNSHLVFNCTVHNITDGASNITWTIDGDEVNGEEVEVTSVVTRNSKAGLGDMRSSLDVARWADEYQEQVINVTCHFSGYKNIGALELTAQVKFYYDISRSLLIGLVSCHVTFAILAVLFVIIIVRRDHHHAL